MKNDESKSDSFGVTFQQFSDEFPDDFLSIKWNISFNQYNVQSMIKMFEFYFLTQDYSIGAWL